MNKKIIGLIAIGLIILTSIINISASYENYSTGVIGGNVYDAETEKPISKAKIVLKSTDSKKNFGPFYTDENGVYSAKVETGNYNVFASKENYYKETQEVTIIEECCTSANFYLKKIIDTKPPVTKHTIKGETGDNNWYINNVELTLTAEDDISGVDKTYYYKETAVPKIYEKSITIEHEGKNNLYYYSTDKVGNQEETKNIEIYVDKTTPITEYKIYEEKAANQNSVEVKLTANDETSGVNLIMYRVYTIKETLLHSTKFQIYNKPFIIKDTGLNKIEFYSIDNAGNQETTKSFTVIVEEENQQTGIIGGKVYDAVTKKPLAKANIFLNSLDTKKSYGPFYTNEDGVYSAEVDTGKYLTTASVYGYNDEVQEVSVIEYVCINVDFYLTRIK